MRWPPVLAALLGVPHLGLGPGLADDRSHPVVEAVATLQDHPRPRGGPDVLRPRLVLVGVGIGLDDLRDPLIPRALSTHS